MKAGRKFSRNDYRLDVFLFRIGGDTFWKWNAFRVGERSAFAFSEDEILYLSKKEAEISGWNIIDLDRGII